jgi:F-type H+-transporting ATPase subunit epsilon
LHTIYSEKKGGKIDTLKKRREEKQRKANMSMPYWRAAGMTYVGYANACAVLVRKCMKEPFKSQTATRERVHFKLSQWLDGVPQQPSKLIPPSSSSCALIFFFFFFLCSHLLLLSFFATTIPPFSLSFCYAKHYLLFKFFLFPLLITPIPIGRESRCFF